jgi:hypothetical protein
MEVSAAEFYETVKELMLGNETIATIIFNYVTQPFGIVSTTTLFGS